MYVNRTELNEQYFQLEFQRELEFITVEKNQMYLREQNPQNTDLDIPLVKNESAYNSFRSEVASLKIYESQAFIIALQSHEATILESASQVNIYDGVPDKQRPMKVQLQVLEIDLAFTKIVDNIIVIEPENNVRMTVELDEEQQAQDVFINTVSFRFSFTEKQFYYKYYSIMDVVIELGGINGIIAPLLASFTQYFIILFIVDLVRKIRRKSKRDYKQFSRVSLAPRLPDYKKAIEKLIEQGPEDDESSILESDADNSQKEGGSDSPTKGGPDVPKEGESPLKKDPVELSHVKKLTKEEKTAQLKADLAIVNELIEHMDITEENLNEIEEFDEEKNSQDEEDEEAAARVEAENQAEEDRQKKEDEEAKKSGKAPIKRTIEYKKLTKLKQLEYQYTNLVMLEKTYSKYMKDFGIRTQIGEIFDDYEEVDKYLNERRQVTFLKVVELFKKRLSFFGIYSLNDQIELTNQKAIYLRKQLSIVVKLLIQFQDKLINDIEAERKETVNFINTRFTLLADKSKQGTIESDGNAPDNF